MKRKKMPVTIAELREDSALWSPAQMLTRAQEHIEEMPAEERPNAAVLVLVWRDDSGGLRTETYRSNMKRDQEIALMGAKWVRCVQDWIE